MTNLLIESINSLAGRWIGWMMAVTLDSAALLALIGLVWLAVRRRVPPQVGYGLFLLVPLKLLLPVDVAAPSSIARWTPSNLVQRWLAPSSDETLQLARIETDADVIRSVGEQATTIESHSPSKAMMTTEIAPEKSLEKVVALTNAVASIQPAAVPQTTIGASLTVSSWLMIAWLIGVVLLIGRIVWSQIRFHRELIRHLTVDAAKLGLDLAGLRHRVSVKQPIRIVESDSLAAPAVWGIFRPTIILPRGISASLTVRQLQWVVLHEMAHIRRRDLVVIGVQRLATVLHFFNPVVWIANRLADQLREYACDDLADAVSDSSAVESSEAFVQILRHVNRNRQSLRGALGVFGWDSRSACFVRVNRLLDSDRPVRTKPNLLALCSLLLLAAFALPHLRAVADPVPEDLPIVAKDNAPKTEPKPDDAADQALAADVGEFELHVVGPDGKSIAEAQIEIRCDPIPTADQIRRGKFIRKGNYGAFVSADAEGRMVVKLPKNMGNFNVSITTPGFGPYWAGWSPEEHSELVPAHFTAELDAAWTVAGIVVDSEGKPVVGATVHPGLRFKKRPGDKQRLGTGQRLKTDAAGRWRFESVPVSLDVVGVAIDHPDLMPGGGSLKRSEFGIEPGQKPIGKILLERGLTVTGTVTDDAGNPIEGALVRTQFDNDRREAKTDVNGVYRLQGCAPRTARIVVSAKGRAVEMQDVSVEANMSPVDFQLQPGGKVRVVVLDHAGKPVPKARLLFQSWRGRRYDRFEFGHVNQYADENGVWEWNEAPLDGFAADIYPPDGMMMPSGSLIARDEEYVFRTPPTLVISGNVIDAETKEPIEKFSVVPGWVWSAGGPRQLSWDEDDRFSVNDGKYQVRHTYPRDAHLIRIEAAGYRAAVSRDIRSDEGNVSIDFKLELATDLSATVLTPDELPAVKASVGLAIAGSQVHIRNGEFRDGQAHCDLRETDAAGKFHFPAQEPPFQLIILHSSGYAHINADSESLPETIDLIPWARVEGTFRAGQKVIPDATLEINGVGIDSYGEGLPRIMTDHTANTDADGHFVFDRVFAGKGRMSQRVVIMVDEGVIPFGSTGMIPIELKEGEKTRIDLGGTGRAVIGKLQPPNGFDGVVNWRSVLIQVGPNVTDPPMPEQPDIPADVAANPVKRAAWMQRWKQTPAGKSWMAWQTAREVNQKLRDTLPVYRACVNRDGTFRIDDMPPGEYVFSAANRGNPGPNLGAVWDQHFEVQPIDGVADDRPIDLGVFQFRK